MNRVMIRLLSLSLLLTVGPRRPRRRQGADRRRRRPARHDVLRPVLPEARRQAQPPTCSPGTGTASPWMVAELDAWMAAAQATGVRPLVAFNRNWARERPPQAAVADALPQELPPLPRALPVRDATSRPGTRPTTPASRPRASPRMAARYYNAMRRDCRRCTIVAADVLDSKDMLAWVKKFKQLRAERPHLGHPQLQGRQRRDRHHEAAAARRQGPGLAHRDRRHPAPEAGRRQPRRPQAHQGPAGQGRQARLQDRQVQPPHHPRLLLRVGEEEGQPLGLGLRRAQRQPCARRTTRSSAACAPAAPSGGAAARSLNRTRSTTPPASSIAPPSAIRPVVGAGARELRLALGG